MGASLDGRSSPTGNYRPNATALVVVGLLAEQNARPVVRKDTRHKAPVAARCEAGDGEQGPCAQSHTPGGLNHSATFGMSTV